MSKGGGKLGTKIYRRKGGMKRGMWMRGGMKILRGKEGRDEEERGRDENEKIEGRMRRRGLDEKIEGRMRRRGGEEEKRRSKKIILFGVFKS